MPTQNRMDMEETIFGFGLVGFLLLCAFVWFRSLVAVDQRHPIVELAHVLGGLVGFLFRMVAKAFRGTKKLVVKLVKLVIEEDRFPLAAITKQHEEELRSTQEQYWTEVGRLKTQHASELATVNWQAREDCRRVASLTRERDRLEQEKQERDRREKAKQDALLSRVYARQAQAKDRGSGGLFQELRDIKSQHHTVTTNLAKADERCRELQVVIDKLQQRLGAREGLEMQKASCQGDCSQSSNLLLKVDTLEAEASEARQEIAGLNRRIGLESACRRKEMLFVMQQMRARRYERLCGHITSLSPLYMRRVRRALKGKVVSQVRGVSGEHQALPMVVDGDGDAERGEVMDWEASGAGPSDQMVLQSQMTVPFGAESLSHQPMGFPYPVHGSPCREPTPVVPIEWEDAEMVDEMEIDAIDAGPSGSTAVPSQPTVYQSTESLRCFTGAFAPVDPLEPLDRELSSLGLGEEKAKGKKKDARGDAVEKKAPANADFILGFADPSLGVIGQPESSSASSDLLAGASLGSSLAAQASVSRASSSPGQAPPTVSTTNPDLTTPPQSTAQSAQAISQRPKRQAKGQLTRRLAAGLGVVGSQQGSTFTSSGNPQPQQRSVAPPVSSGSTNPSAVAATSSVASASAPDPAHGRAFQLPGIPPPDVQAPADVSGFTVKDGEDPLVTASGLQAKLSEINKFFREEPSPGLVWILFKQWQRGAAFQQQDFDELFCHVVWSSKFLKHFRRMQPVRRHPGLPSHQWPRVAMEMSTFLEGILEAANGSNRPAEALLNKVKVVVDVADISLNLYGQG